MRLRVSLGALEEYDCIWTKLVDHLAACSTGRAGNAVIVDDGNRCDFELGTEFGHGCEDGGALGAVGHAVRGVLDVATRKDLPGFREYGGTYPEIRIGRIRFLHGRAGGSQEGGALFLRSVCLLHKFEKSEVSVEAENSGPDCNPGPAIAEQFLAVGDDRLARAVFCCKLVGHLLLGFRIVGAAGQRVDFRHTPVGSWVGRSHA